MDKRWPRWASDWVKVTSISFGCASFPLSCSPFKRLIVERPPIGEILHATSKRDTQVKSRARMLGASLPICTQEKKPFSGCSSIGGGYVEVLPCSFYWERIMTHKWQLHTWLWAHNLAWFCMNCQPLFSVWKRELFFAWKAYRWKSTKINSILQENGPFIYMPTPVGDGGLLYNNVTLQENPYSWSKVITCPKKGTSLNSFKECYLIITAFRSCTPHVAHNLLSLSACQPFLS